jgi:two-component system, NtrC family, nitrogen regulation sensor histidine kinase NtrY
MGQPRSRLNQIMDAAAKDRRRRRRERAIIAVVGMFLAGLLFLVLQFSHLANESTLIQPQIIYFFTVAIWALVLILILVLIFLIVRNLVKYVVERRRYRLRFRLVVAFVVLTVFPAAVLFILSSYILRTSIESLYSPHVHAVVEKSKEVLQANSRVSEAAREVIEGKYEADGEDLLHFAGELARGLLERGWTAQVADRQAEVSPEIGRYLDQKREEYNLALAAVYSRSGELVARSAAEGVSFPEVTAADLERALAGSQGFNPPQTVGNAAVIAAFFPVPRKWSREDPEIIGVAVTARSVEWPPPAGLSDLSAADDARAQLEDFETLSHLELPTSSLYYLLLILVTLMVIFLAIWFGFYMAKGVTEPIQLLAEGTELVASGKLDTTIDIAAEGDDEISILVRSFNQMTRDLSNGRRSLDAAYQSLRDTNLELEQRKSYMETVLAQVTTGVISVGHDELISTVNSAALRMLGRSDPHEVLGQNLAELLAPEEIELYHALAAELAAKETNVVQRQFTASRGERRFVAVLSVSALKDERGESLGMLIMIEDMTDIIRAHRAMAWREVARRIAHEIKNPLTPIQLAAQRIERRYANALAGEEAEVFRQSVHTIIMQVEELKHLVNEFSLFARLPATNPEPKDLNRIIAEVVPLYRDAHSRLSFEVIVDPRLPLLELDAEQMKRVFVNLLDNAVASIAGPGAITIETMYNEQIEIARVEFRDSGCGIPPHIKDRIFEPYYSTKDGGSGLGLTIVSRIIADHGGYIRVADHKPCGTTIIIELPAPAPPRRASAPVAPVAAPS